MLKGVGIDLDLSVGPVLNAPHDAILDRVGSAITYRNQKVMQVVRANASNNTKWYCVFPHVFHRNAVRGLGARHQRSVNPAGGTREVVIPTREASAMIRKDGGID